MMRRVFVLAAGIVFAVPVSGEAQVPWSAPFQMGPGTTDGLGIHLVDPEVGDGVGALVTWRNARVPAGLGLRFGVAEGIGGDLAGYGGLDASGFLLRQTDEFPLELIWAGGAGIGVGDYALLSLPLSIAVGRTLDGEGVRFTPYVGPRLDLHAHLGRDQPPGADDDDLELTFSVDLGADIAFSENLAVRFGASVGDVEALSIGLVFPGVR